MLIRFRCETGSSVSMFETDAKHMLKLMNHSGTVPSAFRPESVEAALTAFLDNLKDETQDDNEENDDEVSVSIRAFPLTELLRYAVKKQEYVMWDYETKVI